jgi:hypothetical protein
LAIGLRWPDFGRTTALNAAACCALLSRISAGQLMYGLVADAPATLYGSDGQLADADHVKLTTNADHNGIRQSRSETDEPKC